MNRSKKAVAGLLVWCLVLYLLAPLDFERAAHAAGDVIVIDNGDPGYAEFNVAPTGSWAVSSLNGASPSGGSRIATGQGNYATWTPQLTAGSYRVLVYKIVRPTASTGDPAVKIDVVHSGTTDTQTHNYAQGTSGWIDLGVFAFAGTGGEFVKATRVTANGNGIYTHADAVKFERIAVSANADLAELSLNTGPLTPSFSPTVTSYTYTVSQETASVQLTARAADAAASVKVNGTAAVGGVPVTVPVQVGQTAIGVTVTSSDGSATRSYAISVTRPAPVSGNASLSGLALSAGELTPTFAPDTLAYSASVPLEKDSVIVTPTAGDPGAHITVNGTAVMSGTDSAPLPLQVGYNAVNVKVTAQDGSTSRDYAVTVTRQTYNTYILDHGDPGYAESGTWSSSTTVKGYANSASRYTTVVNSSITWRPNVTAGQVKVSYYKVNWPDKADPRVKVDIVHNGKTDTVYVDLTPATSGWVELGEYDFAGEGSEYVKLTRISASGSVIYTRADAVKFEGAVSRKPQTDVPLRSRTLDGLAYAEKATLQNADYKVVFHEAAWNQGGTVVRDVYVRTDSGLTLLNTPQERLHEQWVVLTGTGGSRSNYYETMTPDWVTFNEFSQLDANTVQLRDTRNPDKYTLKVTWSLAKAKPEVTYELTPGRDGDYIVGYQSFTSEDESAVQEVLSGARNHAKMTGNVESTGLYELTSPMALVEKPIEGASYTYGIYIPAAQLPLEFEPVGATNQRLGMSLINNEGKVQPILYAPQLGTKSKLKAGIPYSFTLGLTASKTSTYEAYRTLLRDEYGYTAYRQNVQGRSLTDAVFNMIDLLKIDPPEDDSVRYVPNLSGWWSRAKGFIDIENNNSIRTTASSIMLGAYYLTTDSELYDKRALPMLEHGVSRNERGWSPTKDPVYGNESLWKMNAVPFDVTTISTFYDMLRGQNGGLYKLGQQEYTFRDPDQYARGPVIQPLMMYRMTGETRYLDAAKTAADSYIAKEIDTPYSGSFNMNSFFYQYGKLWMEILELYEETKEPKYLNAAYKEAKRYATIFVTRPVPGGTVSVPQPNPFRYNLANNWDAESKLQYERTKLPEELEGGRTAQSWVVSPTGLTFEAGQTSSAYRMNAQEAPFLMRLSAYTGDKLLGDIAHNAVIGRFTNYPGYYYRGFSTTIMEPDFPLRGPTEASSIYYHHAPGQLGQAMDYLITEQMTRSGFNIDFPSVFETDFLWFKYHVYGSKPGTFYGNDNVWLWMPKGVMTTDNSQINWVTAESGNKFYISLTNESQQSENVTLSLNAGLIGLDPARTYPVTIIKDSGQPETTTMTGGHIATTVSARGITAIIVDGVNISVPLHQVSVQEDTSDAGYFFDTYSAVGAVKGMLIVKPDQSSYNAYVQASTIDPSTLHYSTDGGATYTAVPDAIYPMEWSIRVPDTSKTFTYYVEVNGKQTNKRTLYLPGRVGQVPQQPPVQNVPVSIIIDNQDAEVTGAWAKNTTGDDYYFDNYAEAKTAGGAGNRIVWRPAVPENGTYQVYYKLPKGQTSWSSAAQYTVHYAGGEQTYPVDQRSSGGEWTLLGTHPFQAGTGGNVELTAAAAGQLVAADAVMLVNTNVVPQWDHALIASNEPVLERNMSAQLTVTGYYNTGVRGDISGTEIRYYSNRPDLVAIDGTGKITLHTYEPGTNEIEVWAEAVVGGVTLTTPRRTIEVKEFVQTLDFMSPGYSETGVWKQSSLSGFFKHGSRYSEEQGAAATWTPVLHPGHYQVSVYRIVRASGPDPNVQLEIRHNGVTDVTYRDWSQGVTGWVPLGVFEFSGDGTEYVRLTRVTETTDGVIYTQADAVRFEGYSQSAVNSVTLSGPPELQAGGPAETVRVEAAYTDGRTADITGTATLSSSSPEVASITAAGHITPLSAGSTMLKAAYGGKESSYSLSVLPAPPAEPALLSLELVVPKRMNTRAVTREVLVIARYADGTSGGVTAHSALASSNPAVASVSPGGELRAEARGTARISASFGGKTAEQVLTVVGPPEEEGVPGKEKPKP
ncbi:cadherin-like beta sandwich domain-containing protein [Paenibacillus allorhizosphaerae]|uniref:BIG2 domain-containing protein n=1 Tax=Paenibacillus allorhizosphaerae TaxID=2849866 RepID=A0ABM8VNX6_9BACL|nr:cadherin-like beta sandwich domain-containing protein [Paenibacillus allorhizosphaerae]CAG7652198.1 hypothetical protein PAECIP111802_05161 [Paenibacillus allorhizosphaerae]